VKEIFRSIPKESAKVFAKLDAVHGYFQLALDHDSSKLTTFLLPSGRYRYLRAPMGLSSSSDEWCRHSDRAIEGMPWARKIVDDILVWAPDIHTLMDRVRQICTICDDLHITLSKTKLKIGEELPFAGCIVTPEGVRPDPARIECLTKFPRPKDITGVRSFLGLANQLSYYVPDFAHMTNKLNSLTSKHASFIWLPEHEEEFELVKKVLTKHMLVNHFDSRLPVTVLTDASRLHGIGFAMGHLIDGKFHMVVCGSKSLSSAQLSADIPQWSWNAWPYITQLTSAAFICVGTQDSLCSQITAHLSACFRRRFSISPTQDYKESERS